MVLSQSRPQSPISSSSLILLVNPASSCASDSLRDRRRLNLLGDLDRGIAAVRGLNGLIDLRLGECVFDAHGAYVGLELVGRSLCESSQSRY